MSDEAVFGITLVQCLTVIIMTMTLTMTLSYWNDGQATAEARLACIEARGIYWDDRVCLWMSPEQTAELIKE